MKNEDVYKVGDTIFVALSEACGDKVIIKEVGPNRINLFSISTEACPESKLFLKGMKAIKVGNSYTINKTKLQRHLKAWWGQGRQAYSAEFYVWKV